MSLHQMSQTRKRALFGAVIWAVAGTGFLATFFAGGGAGGFHADSGRHLAGAVALAFGFLGYWLVLWLTRQRKGGPRLADERDLRVVALAGQTTLVVVLVGIFATSIVLWTAHESEGVVPVGWMWFLAYGSVILASVTFAVTTLVLDTRTQGHG